MHSCRSSYDVHSQYWCMQWELNKPQSLNESLGTVGVASYEADRRGGTPQKSYDRACLLNPT